MCALAKEEVPGSSVGEHKRGAAVLAPQFYVGRLRRVHELLDDDDRRHNERHRDRSRHARRDDDNVEREFLPELLRKVVVHRLGEHVHLSR